MHRLDRLEPLGPQLGLWTPLMSFSLQLFWKDLSNEHLQLSWLPVNNYHCSVKSAMASLETDGYIVFQ